MLWLPRYGDIWGRKLIVTFTNHIYVVLYLALLFAPNVYSLITVLFIMGVLNSWRTNVGLIYCMELMPVSKQSVTSTVLNILQGFQNLLATVFYMYVTIDWFGFVAIGFVMTVYASVTLSFLPESPIYLLKRERYGELKQTLEQIAAWNGKKLDWSALSLEDQHHKTEQDRQSAGGVLVVRLHAKSGESQLCDAK